MGVNMPVVRAELGRIVRNSPGTQKFARNTALAKLTSYKSALIREYTESNVTQEILQGVEAENISDTLGGEGNLYSFIGFESTEDNPAGRVPEYLRENIDLTQTGKYRVFEGETVIDFGVIAPTEEDFDADFPMPWEPGSWLFKISDGITGLGEYIHHKYFKKGRSKAGLQMEYEVREDEYKPKKYFRAMYAKFLSKIR